MKNKSKKILILIFLITILGYSLIEFFNSDFLNVEPQSKAEEYELMSFSPIEILERQIGSKIGNKLNNGFLCENDDYVFFSLIQKENQNLNKGHIYKLDKKSNKVTKMTDTFGRYFFEESGVIYYSGLEPKGIYELDTNTNTINLIIGEAWLTYLYEPENNEFYYVQDIDYKVKHLNSKNEILTTDIPFSDILFNFKDQIIYIDDSTLRLYHYDLSNKRKVELSESECSSFGITESAIYFTDGNQLIQMNHKNGEIDTFKKNIVSSDFITYSHLNINNDWIYYYEPNIEIMINDGFSLNLCRLNIKSQIKEKLMTGLSQDSMFYLANSTIYILQGSFLKPDKLVFLDIKKKQIHSININQ